VEIIVERLRDKMKECEQLEGKVTEVELNAKAKTFDRRSTMQLGLIRE